MMIVWIIFEIMFLLLESTSIYILMGLSPIYKKIKRNYIKTGDKKHYKALKNIKHDILKTAVLLIFSTFCLIDCFVNNIMG